MSFTHDTIKDRQHPFRKEGTTIKVSLHDGIWRGSLHMGTVAIGVGFFSIQARSEQFLTSKLADAPNYFCKAVSASALALASKISGR